MGSEEQRYSACLIQQINQVACLQQHYFLPPRVFGTRSNVVIGPILKCAIESPSLFMNPEVGCLICILFMGMPPNCSFRLAFNSFTLDVAFTVRSIVWPLKFHFELDGSCGIRMQMGSSSGLSRVAMKSDSDSIWLSAGCGGGGG